MPKARTFTTTSTVKIIWATRLKIAEKSEVVQSGWVSPGRVDRSWRRKRSQR
jgi:hypothetical protein